MEKKKRIVFLMVVVLASSFILYVECPRTAHEWATTGSWLYVVGVNRPSAYCFERAIEMDPGYCREKENSDIHGIYGIVLFRIDRRKHAEEVVENTSIPINALDKPKTILFLYRGISFTTLKKHHEAIKDLSTYINTPNGEIIPEAFTFRAICYESLGEMDKAIRDYREACRRGVNPACGRLEVLFHEAL